MRMDAIRFHAFNEGKATVKDCDKSRIGNQLLLLVGLLNCVLSNDCVTQPWWPTNYIPILLSRIAVATIYISYVVYVVIIYCFFECCQKCTNSYSTHTGCIGIWSIIFFYFLLSWSPIQWYIVYKLIFHCYFTSGNKTSHAQILT